ncbi:MAG: Zn-ribbon domain-containing OB-fold protein [Promethearchaeota archaeon]
MSEKLIAYKCTKCGKIEYPRHTRCHGCRNREFEEVEVTGEGTLVTFTKLKATPTGIDTPTLVLGMVEFENGVRYTGQILAEEPEIGMKLYPVWGRVRTINNQNLHAFQFRSVK